MRYKILINSSKAALLKDFFVHMGDKFKCLSTSSNWEDINEHIKLFKPHAYVCLFDSSDNEMITQLYSVKRDLRYSGMPIIVIGDAESCNVFENRAQGLATLMIRRPITTNNMAEKINTLLVNNPWANKTDEEREAEEREEAQKLEAMRKSLSKNDDYEEQFTRFDPLKKHVLIVDDDKSVLKMLKIALSGEYNVTTMASGKMAEKFLKTKTTNIILLDYEMPEETGPEVFKKIRNNDLAKDIPIVFLTGVSDRNKIEEVLALKPQGYLLKPIDMKRLFSTIEKLTK